MDVILRNIGQLATCSGAAGSAESMLGLCSRAALGIQAGRVTYVGPENQLPRNAVQSQTRVVDVGGGLVGPGFVDPHTHVVFAGSRADEFEARCQGRTYLEIAQAGGGITRTVTATQQASVETLVSLSLPRLERLLAQGVTTCEVKSGYGLTLEAERRMLQAVAALRLKQPISLHSTFLGLHTLPAGVAREAFVEEVLRVQLPALTSLCTTVDAFIEKSAFSPDDARALAGAAKAHGLTLRLHVDQLTAGAGAELAAALGAQTADHLEQVSAAGIAALAKAGTVAVLAPTSTLFAKVRPFAPGRALRDAGVPVALCTNINPGSSNSENVGLALGLGCVENGLTPAEAYLGFTRFAGLALGDAGLGRLEVGGPADAVVFNAQTYRDLAYHFAVSDVRMVLKAGQVVWT